jgi:hypothetical protein
MLQVYHTSLVLVFRLYVNILAKVRAIPDSTDSSERLPNLAIVVRTIECTLIASQWVSSNGPLSTTRQAAHEHSNAVGTPS